MATRARFLAPFALAALSAAAALSLGRVFASGRFVVPVLVAVALAHVIGALARRFGLPLWATVLLESAGLASFVVVAIGPAFTLFGVGFGSSSSSFTTQLDAGWELLRTAPPPAPVTDGALLLAGIAVFTVAAVADWFAFRRDTVLAAMAPALLLFVWAATLGTSAYRTAAVLAFAAAAAAFVLVQNLAVLDRGRSWLVSQHAGRSHWLAPAVLLLIVAVAAGVLLAPAVPGAGADPILEFADHGRDDSGGQSYQTGVAPLVDVSAKLNGVDDTELFTVAAPQPDYWRVAALDRFTPEGGGQWTLEAEGDEVDVGLPTTGPDVSLHQEFVIGPMSERWLPAAYRPVAIDLDGTLVVKSSSTLVADAASVKNLRYSVDSLPPPNAAAITPELAAATVKPTPARLSAFTDVPSDMPEEIAATAQMVVDNAGATTPYGRARALRDFFRSGAFFYDTSVDPVDTPDATAAFLQDKRGFCVQFATAYALMARTLGIPSRIAVGFTPGEKVDGVFHVSAHDAHAWPEIWLAGMGWTHLFDPTPAAGSPGTAASGESGGSELPAETAVALPSESAISTPPPTTPPPGSGPGTAPSSGSSSSGSEGSQSAPSPTPDAARPEVTTDQPGSDTPAWLVVALVLLAVAVAFGAYVTVVLTAKSRRRAHRRGGEPADAVQGAWNEALDQLHEARVVTDPTRTPLELARATPEGASAAARPLRDLARRYTAARYGEVGPTADEAVRAWSSIDALAEALAAGVSRRERWRRHLDPSTLRAHASSRAREGGAETSDALISRER